MAEKEASKGRTEEEQEKLNRQLWDAADRGDEETIRDCIDKDAELEYIGIGLTPVLAVALGGHLNAVKILIEGGSNLGKKDRSGRGIVLLSCSSGNLDLVRYLAEEHGLGLGETSTHGWNAAHWASVRGHLEVLKYLEENKVDIKGLTNDGSNCLHIACQWDHLPFIRYLMKKGLKLDTPDKG